jgi:hypothetical protein
MKCRIDSVGFENFTGRFGSVEFVDGFSVDGASQTDIDRLGNIIRVVLVDDTGADGEICGVANKLEKRNLVIAEEVFAEANKPEEIVEEVLTDQGNDQAEESVQSEFKYTREMLEGLADKSGIGELRNLAKEHNIKGRSISELIAALSAVRA